VRLSVIEGEADVRSYGCRAEVVCSCFTTEKRYDSVGCLINPSLARKIIVRRPTFHQGRALEILGHAIEYLADSALYDPHRSFDGAAMNILRAASRDVFAECPEKITLSQHVWNKARNLKNWLLRIDFV
jgi:hypothetical protein